ncbi:MAG: alpha-amylase family glycosyl hydrolase [Candidatus Hodarchaeota archaeon]
MQNHRNLYEINTRVWLYNLEKEFDEEITILKIPDSIWWNLKEKGFDWIWLMGVWKHSQLSIEDLKRHLGLLREIDDAFPNWKPEDVIGSPYSIIEYTLNPKLGKPNDLIQIKRKLNQIGIKLMLDFIPNHFGNASHLVRTNPELFVSSIKKPTTNSDLFTNIETEKGPYWVAYGKDPYFPPWDDTFQLNYFNLETRKLMMEILLEITDKCDGIRCDMAMLCLNEVIANTWGWFLSQKSPETEFWKEAIEKVQEVDPKFYFLAEVYWDLGWQLQQLGFNYTYDKRLYDRLKNESSKEIREHLQADLEFQKHCVRFIENHDEIRVIKVFGRAKSMAAAIIMGTTPGMSLYHQGQLEGFKLKIPVQLRQKKVEHQDEEIKSHYCKLLEFTNQDVFRRGQWRLLNITEAGEKNLSWQNLLAWQWDSNKIEKISLIIVNYASIRSIGIIFPLIPEAIKNKESLIFKDIMENRIFIKNTDDLTHLGLYVDLQPYKSHLLIVSGS